MDIIPGTDSLDICPELCPIESRRTFVCVCGPQHARSEPLHDLRHDLTGRPGAPTRGHNGPQRAEPSRLDRKLIPVALDSSRKDLLEKFRASFGPYTPLHPSRHLQVRIHVMS